MDSLARKGINREILNIIHEFLSNRETNLAFNGFESAPFALTHGLPQGSPRSPLLYLLYNTSLLDVADTTNHAEALGFIDDVVLLTSANDNHQLKGQMQTLAYRQLQWAKRHGAIFDVNKSNWVLFSPQEPASPITIDFGDRKRLAPIHQVKWLGITFDDRLTFKQHRLNTLAKGSQRSGFLASISHSQWGIPPHLLKTLLTTTIHAAIDYGVAAWMPLEVPRYFTDKLSTIDHTCARAALGALKSTPAAFLDHDFGLTPPKIRLQAKILQYIAKALTKPNHHPAHGFAAQARSSDPRCHHNPYHRFFQHKLCKTFDNYIAQTTLDPSIQLRRPPNYNTLIRNNEERAKAEAKHLKPNAHHLIMYTDGSRLPKENTAAAAWSQKSNKTMAEGLGPARSYGIYEAEYRGLHLGLTLALREASVLTRIITIILDNQSVIKDMKSITNSLTSLLDK